MTVKPSKQKPSAFANTGDGRLADSRTHNQGGFGFTLVAVVISVVMGLTVSLALRQVSTQSAELSDMYAASQARWSAIRN